MKTLELVKSSRMSRNTRQGARVTVRVELTPRAKAARTAFWAPRISQQALLSRLAEWFAHQDATVQSIAMSYLPAELRTVVARMILRPKRKA